MSGDCAVCNHNAAYHNTQKGDRPCWAWDQDTKDSKCECGGWEKAEPGIVKPVEPTPATMRIELNIHPLSVNEAWQGRRFSTPAKTQYEAAMRLLLPNVAVPGPYYRIEYDFHMIHFKTTDWDNLVKVTQDCLVKRGIITDDRFIVDARVRKYPAKADHFVIRVEGCTLGVPGAS